MAESTRKATTLREELYNIAAKTKATKERKKAVDAYLEDMCRKAACEGEFKVGIPNDVKIDYDGRFLTYEELESFGKENDIRVIIVNVDSYEDYHKYMAVLDFDL